MSLLRETFFSTANSVSLFLERSKFRRKCQLSNHTPKKTWRPVKNVLFDLESLLTLFARKQKVVLCSQLIGNAYWMVYSSMKKLVTHFDLFVMSFPLKCSTQGSFIPASSNWNSVESRYEGNDRRHKGFCFGVIVVGTLRRKSDLAFVSSISGMNAYVVERIFSYLQLRPANLCKCAPA